MPNSHVPKFIVDAVYYAWKFVNGAFGKKVERPWRHTICGPFWVSLAMLTVGLPLTLVGWLVVLIFGKGKAEKYGDFVYEHSAFFCVAITLGLVTLLVCSLVFWIWPLIQFFIFIGIVTGSAIMFIGIVILIDELGNRKIGLFKPLKPEKQKVVKVKKLVKFSKKPNSASSFFKTVYVVFRKATFWFSGLLILGLAVFIVVFKPILMVLAFLKLMVHAAYKKYCPLVVKE